MFPMAAEMATATSLYCGEKYFVMCALTLVYTPKYTAPDGEEPRIEIPMPDHKPPMPLFLITSAAALIGPNLMFGRACWIVLIVSRG